MNAPRDDGRPSSPARRKLLIVGAATGVAGAAGAMWIGSRYEGPHAWIEAVVRTNLPGVQLDPATLAKFVAEFAQRREIQGAKASLALMLNQSIPSLTRRVAKARHRIERLERRIVTEYLVGSNFFRVRDPRAEMIFYASALPACGNPFAVFRDA